MTTEPTEAAAMDNNKYIARSDLEKLQKGGVYIPPFKMRRLQAKIAENKKSEAYQRLQWEALRKSINGPVNKVNIANIKHIAVELLQQNIIRGRGLFCRSIMKAQMASPNFTPVYAALVAIINSKIPEIGELLSKRVIFQFGRAFRRNDKILMKSVGPLIAHLTNQRVLHELLVIQIIHVLLRQPTDDSVEVSKEIILQCGQTLSKIAPKAMRGVYETMRAIFQESQQINDRVKYELESLFEAFRTKFADYPAMPEELDLIDDDDVVEHHLSLDDPHDPERLLDVFHYDPQWDEHERQYDEIRKSILGEESDSDNEQEDKKRKSKRGEGKTNGEEEEEEDDDEGEEDKDSDSGESKKLPNDNDNEEGEEEEGQEGDQNKADKVNIHDLTNTNVMNLRRNIYLTFVSSVSAEEMAHKILKCFENNEKQVAYMILEACAHERSHRKQYGLLAERLSKVKPIYEDAFDELFPRQYEDIHLLDTNKIRNVARFFAYLLYSDALDWSILEYIKVNEHDTNPSKRIFIKVLFQELAAHMGMKLKQRLESGEYGNAFDGLFPKDNPKNTRFSINFFTTIGLGGLTESMRAHLKSYQKKILKQQQEMVSSSDSESNTESDDNDNNSGSGSDSDNKGSTSGGSDSDNEKEKDKKSSKKNKNKNKNKNKDKDKNKDKNKSKSKEKDKNKDKDKDKDKTKEKKKTSKEKQNNGGEMEKELETEDIQNHKDRNKDQDRDRDRDRDRNRDRNRNGDKDRKNEKDRDRKRENRRHEKRSYSRSRSRSRSK